MLESVLLLEKVLKDGVNLDDSKVHDLTFAATALAKQMMETTKDAALNAKTVLGYNLPASFADLPDGEAKKMIQNGHFYNLANTIVQQVQAGDFPMPDPTKPLDCFLDATGKGIAEDSKQGGDAYSYGDAYKAHMKALAKANDVKGKNLFHPVRLALTGEMSGQDVTKQLSLLALVEGEGSVVDEESVRVVSFADRIEQLKSFTETIPEEFRAPQDKTSKKKADAVNGVDANSGNTDASSSSSTAAAPAVADPKDTYDGLPITALDIRVGQVVRVWEHEEADKLYCEEIDVGEDEPRQIASGLRPFMGPEDLEGKKVLVLCNLKARKLVGFPSHGMVLCASNSDHTDVRLIAPPVDAKIGERVTVPDFDFEGEESAPFAENKVGKKKVVEKLAPFLVTSKYGVPEFLGRPFMTTAGVCTSPIADGLVG